MSVKQPTTRDAATFQSVSPATGEVVGTFPIDGPAQVAAALDRARTAAAWWAGLGFDGRKRRLLDFKRLLVRRGEELCDLIHRENGKPHDDAFLELLIAVEHLDWAARKAAKILRPERVAPTLLARNVAASIHYQPLGVVAVIGPWNYPLPQGTRPSRRLAGCP